MKKSVELIGLKVISISEGKELGTVKELIIDPALRTVAGLVIDDGQWYFGAKVLPYSSILNVGEYAVMIENSQQLTLITQSSQIAGILDLGIKIIGAKILAKTGRIIGTATEFLIDKDGSVSACEVELVNNGGAYKLPNDLVLTYGKEVIVVTEQELA